MGLQLPGELVTLLQDLGYNWPEADEQKLFELAMAWTEFAPRLDPIADQLDAAARRVWTDNSGEAVSAFRDRWTADGAPLASLRDAATGAEVVGPVL